ncbi:hypothetical protein [Paenibacillus amylolyticus]|uniref:SMODS-associated NUDIX domain-containing protein n=1 Tax=Paenibacillus amylolyticus TaxID=1451 RepID=UPI00249AAFE6|nr:hypothetical protein [Paenibacillus amylolyticus]WFA83469.1 hypothetical protein OGI70_20915 [Paenibacillus amylolyticus]
MKGSWIFFFSILVVCFLLSLVGSFSNFFASISTSIIASVIIIIVSFVFKNYGKINLYLRSKFILRNKYIRVSISYLFRIKIDQKYFLVKGNRISQYAPVGGVYKRYVDSLGIFRELEVLDDNLIPIDQSSKDDLRVRVKGKYLMEFISWFEKGHNREISGEREFYEELILSGILPKEKFPYINYSLIKRKIDRIRFDEHVNSDQILIADIYDLNLTTEQLEAFRGLVTSSDLYSFETEDSINRLGADRKNLPIGRHTKWTI